MTEHGDLLTKQPINVAGDVSDDTISLLRVQVIRGVACVDNLVNVISSARRENLEIKNKDAFIHNNNNVILLCHLAVRRYCNLRETYSRDFLVVLSRVIECRQISRVL